MTAWAIKSKTAIAMVKSPQPSFPLIERTASLSTVVAVAMAGKMLQMIIKAGPLLTSPSGGGWGFAALAMAQRLSKLVVGFRYLWSGTGRCRWYSILNPDLWAPMETSAAYRRLGQRKGVQHPQGGQHSMLPQVPSIFYSQRRWRWYEQITEWGERPSNA